MNYDEDSSLEDWTFADFNSFAIDISCDGLRDACHYLDLRYWEDEEDSDDDIDWDDPLEDFDKEDDDLLFVRKTTGEDEIIIGKEALKTRRDTATWSSI